jgi:hypothetical protein
MLVLTACLPQQPTATPDPTEVANRVATSVALTISAAQTQTQAAEVLPTNTTLPTQTDTAAASVTPTPTLTATPFVIIPPTSTVAPPSGGGGGGGGGGSPPAWDCTPINNRPRDNTVFKKGEEFDIKWTIKNTGTKTIPAKLDVKYFSGPVMMKNPADTFRELPEIKPGATAVIIIDAVAPVEKGFHVMTWRVEGHPPLCAPYVAIIVE